MKKISKLLCLVLSLVFTFTFAVGCNGASSAGETEYWEYGKYEGNTLHEYNLVERADEFILNPNGAVEYTVVLPNETHTRVGLAGSDFVDIFMKSTGKTIIVEKENDVVWTEDSKYISIGCEGLEAQAKEVLVKADRQADADKITLSDDINANGFEIKTVANTIFIMAQDAAGALFGTYELLTRLVGYERYMVDFYTVDTKTSIPMYDINIRDNPDIERRIGPWGAVYSDTTNASRMRFLNQYKDVYSVYKPLANEFHNTLDFLDVNLYYEDHPNWYAQKNVEDPKPYVGSANRGNVHQLCYTASVKSTDADKSEYYAMVEACAERMCIVLENDLVNNIITLTQEDNTNYCKCEACVEATAHYGVISGAMYTFLLDVTDEIMEWIDVNQEGRDVLVAMFAYQTYQQAPATPDEDGVWHPKTVLMSTKEENVGKGLNEHTANKNAAIFYAASTAQYSYSFYQSENIDVQTAIAGWKVCCNNFGFWGYQTLYDNYFMPYNNFGTLQENYKAVIDMGARWIFNQGQQGNNNLTAFNNFKLYLNSKFEWNVNLEYQDLFNNYFNATFGPASEIMKEYFLSLVAHMKWMGDMGDIESSIADPGYFPWAIVKQWITYCEQALEIIEPVKTQNRELYNAYEKNILVESLMSRYMRIFWYEASLDPIDLKIEKRKFKEDVIKTGYSQWSQGEDVNQIMGGF